jgi:hypothetical protein
VATVSASCARLWWCFVLRFVLFYQHVFSNALRTFTFRYLTKPQNGCWSGVKFMNHDHPLFDWGEMLLREAQDIRPASCVHRNNTVPTLTGTFFALRIRTFQRDAAVNNDSHST